MKFQAVKFPGKKALAAAGLLLIAAVLAGAAWRAFSARQDGSGQESALNTVAVTRGSIELNAVGTGSLEAGVTLELDFPVEGRVAQLNVAAGQKVSQGDVLAVLDGMDSLELAVSSASLELQAAQKTLAEMEAQAPGALAQARIDLAAAQEAYDQAQRGVLNAASPRCEKSLTEEYYFQYRVAQHGLNVWEAELGGVRYGRQYALEHIYVYTAARDQAYANWKYCEGYTRLEIDASRAAFQAAEAALGLAQLKVDELAANAGLDPEAYALAQVRVKSAQAGLELARSNLAGATLTAPMDGVVMSVQGEEGKEPSGSPFITLSDLEHPVLDATVDEADLTVVTENCPAQVTFDSIDGRTFSGEVTRIDPALTQVGSGDMPMDMPADDGVDMLHVTIALDDLGLDTDLPVGLLASADLTCQSASDALLIPVEAVHSAADGSNFVIVQKDDGTLEKRALETGLNDTIQVEVLSGLEEGELVVIDGVDAQALEAL